MALGRRVALSVCVAAVLGLSASSALAQGLVIREGTRVRLTWSPPDEVPEWIVGTVGANSAGGSLVLLPEGSEQPTTVLLDAETRLQLFAGRRARWPIGVAIGGGVGAALGAALLSDGFGNVGTDGSAFERTQGALVFGVVGALAGVLLANLSGPERWNDIPLRGGQIPVPPLTIPWSQRLVSVTSPQRWTVFPATDVDFIAYFGRHADSLMSIEGVWEVRGGIRFAVVRDQRYLEFDFVAVRLARVGPSEPAPLPNDMGPLFAALRAGAEPDQWDMLVMDRRSVLRNRAVRAQRRGPLLAVSADGRVVEQWVKIFP